MLPLAQRLIASERLRHAAIAIALAVLVAVTTILRPLDITVWSLQAKLFDHAPSGDIVFVEVDRGEESTANSAENQRLASALRRLDRAGAEEVILDLSIQRSNSSRADIELRDQLIAMSDRVLLTQAIQSDFIESRQVRRTDVFFERGMKITSNDYQTDFLGYVWGMQPSYSNSAGDAELPALWTALADEVGREGAIYPDYSIDVALIPRYGLPEVMGDAAAQRFRGKTVVMGLGDEDARTIKVPARGVVPSSLMHIMAAETAVRGSGGFFGWMPVLVISGIVLISGLALWRRQRARRIFYVVWLGALVLVIVATAWFGIRALFAGPLALVAIYALQRLVVNFKRRHLFLEPRSRLPNFVALQRDFGNEPIADNSVAIVVAKIARLDAIFATLTPADQGRYLRQLASRLALGDSTSTIYYDGGKYFAFAINSAEYQDVQGHLEGLRAVASQSIAVSQRVLDVSMTIGVDESPAKPVSSRLSSAIAAADQAREAYRPVFVIADFSAESEEWDYSLQSRLEDALSEDRISIKLQPQVALNDGRIVGVEALARWVDEEKGEIAPSRFILQCERVGRLDELTKRVLSKSLNAAEALQSRGTGPTMSVNVSAIQFVDGRIAELIEKNLATHALDPKNLVIEVTETARIEDFKVARDVFEQIKCLGVRFSIDDFGIASANLDALFALPFDELKIDQIFVQQVHRSATARAIVANVARLARDAGLQSVAEGIETHEIYTLLREMGCDIGQGYFIGRPMALGQLQEMIILQKDSVAARMNFG